LAKSGHSSNRVLYGNALLPRLARDQNVGRHRTNAVKRFLLILRAIALFLLLMLSLAMGRLLARAFVDSFDLSKRESDVAKEVVFMTVKLTNFNMPVVHQSDARMNSVYVSKRKIHVCCLIL
jgi:hypothetical protein